MDSSKPTQRWKEKTKKAIPFMHPMKVISDEALIVRDWKNDASSCSEGEVVIEVKAIGVNSADVLARCNLYPNSPSFPFISGFEVSGVIVETGSKVSHVKIGDRVLAILDFGGYAEFVKCRAEGVAKIPNEWSFSEAASVGVQFATAYHVLYNTGPLIEGDRVLIHACSSLLGMTCLQLALHAKCEVYGTCGNAEKAKMLKEKGAHHVINYSTSDFEAEVKKLTNGEGVDIIIDAVGGSYFKKDLNILSTNGRIVGLGGASVTGSKGLSALPQALSLSVSTIDMMQGSKSFCGVSMRSIVSKKPKLLQSILASLVKLFESNVLRPNPILEFSWMEVAKAHRLLESGKTHKKIVLVVTSDKLNPTIEHLIGPPKDQTAPYIESIDPAVSSFEGITTRVTGRNFSREMKVKIAGKDVQFSFPDENDTTVIQLKTPRVEEEGFVSIEITSGNNQACSLQNVLYYSHFMDSSKSNQNTQNVNKNTTDDKKKKSSTDSKEKKDKKHKKKKSESKSSPKESKKNTSEVKPSTESKEQLSEAANPLFDDAPLSVPKESPKTEKKEVGKEENKQPVKALSSSSSGLFGDDDDNDSLLFAKSEKKSESSKAEEKKQPQTTQTPKKTDVETETNKQSEKTPSSSRITPSALFGDDDEGLLFAKSEKTESSKSSEEKKQPQAATKQTPKKTNASLFDEGDNEPLSLGRSKPDTQPTNSPIANKQPEKKTESSKQATQTTPAKSSSLFDDDDTGPLSFGLPKSDNKNSNTKSTEKKDLFSDDSDPLSFTSTKTDKPKTESEVKKTEDTTSQTHDNPLFESSSTPKDSEKTPQATEHIEKHAVDTSSTSNTESSVSSITDTATTSSALSNSNKEEKLSVQQSEELKPEEQTAEEKEKNEESLTSKSTVDTTDPKEPSPTTEEAPDKEESSKLSSENSKAEDKVDTDMEAASQNIEDKTETTENVEEKKEVESIEDKSGTTENEVDNKEEIEGKTETTENVEDKKEVKEDIEDKRATTEDKTEATENIEEKKEVTENIEDKPEGTENVEDKREALEESAEKIKEAKDESKAQQDDKLEDEQDKVIGDAKIEENKAENKAEESKEDSSVAETVNVEEEKKSSEESKPTLNLFKAEEEEETNALFTTTPTNNKTANNNPLFVEEFENPLFG